MLRLVLCVLLALPGVGVAQWRNQLTDAQLQAAVALTDRLYRSVDPTLKENNYFPEALKEKLSWVYKKRESGELGVFVATDNRGLLNRGTLMRAAYTRDGQMRIEFPAHIAYATSQDPEIRTLVGGRQLKNSFAVGLAHEATHLLGLPRSFFETPRSTKVRDLVVQEELRTWTEVDEHIVAPLLDAFEPLHESLVQFNKVRKGCKKAGHECPVIRAFIESAIPQF
jgi:hypothetical protein